MSLPNFWKLRGRSVALKLHEFSIPIQTGHNPSQTNSPWFMFSRIKHTLVANHESRFYVLVCIFPLRRYP